MNIRLIVVGKTEEPYLVQGISDYSARLTHYCKFSILEIPELKNAKSLSRDQIKQKEGELILKNITPKDELVLLWNLLYAFFDKSETIRSGKSKEEALLTRSFDRIFEDMVDGLIGDDMFADMKSNEDGKEIDHIYKDRSLLDDRYIYYIGDSKYYFFGGDLDKKSLYKQCPYAKNIIQLNIDIFNKPPTERKEDERQTIMPCINELFY